MAAVSSSGSTTPTASARPPSSTRRSATTSTGSGLTRTPSSASPSASTSTSASSSGCATAGRVYACYETPEELELRRKILLGRGLPPVYERQAARRARHRGAQPHWRFRLDHDAPIDWNDLIRGQQRFDPHLLSDPVVRREDGSWLYLLPSVIDDVDLGVTHMVRGEDHVSNSATQIQMFDALGAEPPHFAHEALLVAAEGKFSKRLGSVGVEVLRGSWARADGLAVAARPTRHFAAGRAAGRPRRARRRLRLRAFRPRAGAFRPSRCRTAQCPPAPSPRLRRCRGSVARRRNRGGLAAAARQSRHGWRISTRLAARSSTATSAAAAGRRRARPSRRGGRIAARSIGPATRGTRSPTP